VRKKGRGTKKRRSPSQTNHIERERTYRDIIIIIISPLVCVCDGKAAAQVFLSGRDGWHYI
jgi:hypothetical protein